MCFQRSCTLWGFVFLKWSQVLGSNRRAKYWLKCHQIATYIAAKVLANFCWKQEATVWYISVQGCDWIRTLVQFATMILLLLSIGCLHQLEKGSESEMWSRYNGVLHRSAQNYWPLSGFSLSSTHPPQHPPLISSPSAQGFQEELGIVNHAFVQLPPCFTDSIPLSLNIQRKLWPTMLSHISQNSKWSSKEMRLRRAK